MRAEEHLQQDQGQEESRKSTTQMVQERREDSYPGAHLRTGHYQSKGGICAELLQ